MGTVSCECNPSRICPAYASPYLVMSRHICGRRQRTRTRDISPYLAISPHSPERLARRLCVEAHRELHGMHPPDKVHVRSEERGAEQLHDALPRRQREDEGGGGEQQREPPSRERVAPLEEAANSAEALQRLSEPLLLWRKVGGEHALDRVEVLLTGERCEEALSTVTRGTSPRAAAESRLDLISRLSLACRCLRSRLLSETTSLTYPRLPESTRDYPRRPRSPFAACSH